MSSRIIISILVLYYLITGRTIEYDCAVRVIQALLADMILDDDIEPIVDEVLHHIDESAEHQNSITSQFCGWQSVTVTDSCLQDPPSGNDCPDSRNDCPEGCSKAHLSSMLTFGEEAFGRF